jgi:hypothetical protein
MANGDIFKKSGGVWTKVGNLNGVQGSTGATGPGVATYTNTVDIVLIADGNGMALGTGVKGYLEIDFACTITVCSLLADQVGSCVADLWLCTYAQFDGSVTHPVAGDSIAASAKPTLSSAIRYQDSTLTGWTVAIPAGSVLALNLTSSSTITRLNCTLKVTKN